MLMFWPWAQTDPIENPIARARLFFAPDLPVRATLFAGQSIPATDLPWTYLPTLYRARSAGTDPCPLALRRRRGYRPRSGATASRLGRERGARRLSARLRDRLSGRLRDCDQSGAVRRHAPFHLRAAADRGCGARWRPIGLSPGWRSSRIAGRSTSMLALYGCLHVRDHGSCCIPTNMSITTRSSAGSRAHSTSSSSITGPTPMPKQCRASRIICATQYGADFEEREFSVAVCGPPISARLLFSGEFSLTPKATQRRLLHRLHQGQLRPVAAGPADLPGGKVGRASLGGARPPADPRRNRGSQDARARVRRRPCHEPGHRLSPRSSADMARAIVRAAERGIAPMERCEYEKLDRAEGTMWWFAALAREPADRGAARGGLRGTGRPGPRRRLRHRRAPRPIGRAGAGGKPCSGSTPTSGPACAPEPRAPGRSAPDRSMHLPFADGTFAAILSADVLCHGDVDERAALREFHRCLAADGRLILNLPSYRWMLSRHDAAVHNVRRYTRPRTGPFARGRPASGRYIRPTGTPFCFR